MPSKIRFILPLIQMTVAIILTLSNRLRVTSLSTTAWEAPDRQFCDALNAPAALIRYFILKVTDRWFPDFYPVEFTVETVIYFVLVGLIWYLVGVEIHGGGESVVTHKIRGRRAVDALLILFGAALVTVGVLVRHQFGYPATTYANLIAIPYFIWGATIAVFYGHDLLTTRRPQMAAV